MGDNNNWHTLFHIHSLWQDSLKWVEDRSKHRKVRKKLDWNSPSNSFYDSNVRCGLVWTLNPYLQAQWPLSPKPFWLMNTMIFTTNFHRIWSTSAKSGLMVQRKICYFWQKSVMNLRLIRNGVLKFFSFQRLPSPVSNSEQTSIVFMSKVHCYVVLVVCTSWTPI